VRYVRVVAAGDKGAHGVELWAIHDVPCAHDVQGHPPCFCEDDLCVVDHDERLLMVRIVAPYVRIDVVVCHTPVSPKNKERRLLGQGVVGPVRDEDQAEACPTLPTSYSWRYECPSGV
jgi:hypothetical protein